MKEKLRILMIASAIVATSPLLAMERDEREAVLDDNGSVGGMAGYSAEIRQSSPEVTRTVSGDVSLVEASGAAAGSAFFASAEPSYITQILSGVMGVISASELPSEKKLALLMGTVPNIGMSDERSRDFLSSAYTIIANDRSTTFRVKIDVVQALRSLGAGYEDNIKAICFSLLESDDGIVAAAGILREIGAVDEDTREIIGSGLLRIAFDRETTPSQRKSAFQEIAQQGGDLFSQSLRRFDECLQTEDLEQLKQDFMIAKCMESVDSYKGPLTRLLIQNVESSIHYKRKTHAIAGIIFSLSRVTISIDTILSLPSSELTYLVSVLRGLDQNRHLQSLLLQTQSFILTNVGSVNAANFGKLVSAINLIKVIGTEENKDHLFSVLAGIGDDLMTNVNGYQFSIKELLTEVYLRD